MLFDRPFNKIVKCRLEVACLFKFVGKDAKFFSDDGVDYKVQRNSAIGWVNPNLSAGVKGYTLASASPSTSPVLKGELYGYTTCLNEFAAFAECLTVVSPEVSPQFIVHWRLEGTITHPLPVYNIPGNGALL